MSKPVSEWDEAYILSLPKEDDELERKGSLKLDLTAGADENDVLAELAKQLSAFANMGGGKIIYGLKDSGAVDAGGVSTQVKNGTKEWLERQIPILTEFEILGFKVFEFGPSANGSQIGAGKALYVVEVPDSDRAPHQSRKDFRYYVRLGSQSLPAPHKMIEDIRNRQTHPRVSISEITVELQQDPSYSGPPGLWQITTVLNLYLINEGTLKSADTFVRLEPETGHISFLLDKEIADPMNGSKKESYQWQLRRPIPPQSEIRFRVDYRLQAATEPLGGHLVWWDKDKRTPLEDVGIIWTIFADSAPARAERITLGHIGLIRLVNQRVHFN